MNERIEHIRIATEPLRQQIIHHKLYAVIKDVDDLKIFMQYHIFAVWDFMSLLKTLQNKLTCTSVPWFPKSSADTRRLINQIVVDEESDCNSEGKSQSHFELYLDAMRQCKADTSQIETFINVLQESGDLDAAFNAADVPPEVRSFVGFTFKTIADHKDYVQASIFTFGREDLIPNMFHSIIGDIHKNFPDSISIFKYYLERHIEVDGGQHSQLALQMTSNLCGSNEQYWKEAEQAAIACLQKRIDLWDGIYWRIVASKERQGL